jgi:hypothetical protein
VSEAKVFLQKTLASIIYNRVQYIGLLKQIYQQLYDSQPIDLHSKFPHITITESAFPPQNERDVMFYSHWFKQLNLREPEKTLCQLVLTSILEEVSYTRKLENHSRSIGQYKRYQTILSVVQNNSVFKEINQALQTRWQRGDINNKGVLTMVEQYFTELTFVFAELFRTCQSKAYVVFVNDNVRYGGEVIPVDLLSTYLVSIRKRL